MASCTKCGNALKKRNDNWFHCRKHGPQRRVNTPIPTVSPDGPNEVLDLGMNQSPTRINVVTCEES